MFATKFETGERILFILSSIVSAHRIVGRSVSINVEKYIFSLLIQAANLDKFKVFQTFCIESTK